MYAEHCKEAEKPEIVVWILKMSKGQNKERVFAESIRTGFNVQVGRWYAKCGSMKQKMKERKGWRARTNGEWVLQSEYVPSPDGLNYAE